jgi:glutathionyl-hydroquinone reductase
MNIISQFPRESSNGSFKRQKSIFRSIIDEEGQYKPEKGRYHLYLSYACPWAHRTLIVRELKELDAVVSVPFVNPIRDDKGWCFESENNQYIDSLNGFNYLMEAYKIMDSKLEYIENLIKEKNKKVYSWDPYVDESYNDVAKKFNWTNEKILHTFFIGTKHPDFTKFKFPNNSIIIDPFRYIYNIQGSEIIRIGDNTNKI